MRVKQIAIAMFLFAFSVFGGDDVVCHFDELTGRLRGECTDDQDAENFPGRTDVVIYDDINDLELVLSREEPPKYRKVVDGGVFAMDQAEKDAVDNEDLATSDEAAAGIADFCCFSSSQGTIAAGTESEICLTTPERTNDPRNRSCKLRTLGPNVCRVELRKKGQWRVDVALVAVVVDAEIVVTRNGNPTVRASGLTISWPVNFAAGAHVGIEVHRPNGAPTSDLESANLCLTLINPRGDGE